MQAAGERTERITILEPNERSGLVGESETTYHAARQVWASVEALSGRKLSLHKQAGFLATHEVRCIHFDINPRSRICWRGDDYTIENAIAEGRQRDTLLITMSRIVSREE